MITAPAIQVLPDLSIVVGTAIAVVSPSQAFVLAEQLIRTAARRALAEEAEQGVLEGRSPEGRFQ